jgi:hypothetical protein
MIILKFRKMHKGQKNTGKANNIKAFAKGLVTAVT